MVLRPCLRLPSIHYGRDGDEAQLQAPVRNDSASRSKSIQSDAAEIDCGQNTPPCLATANN
jgi:hypothetical protein